MRRGYFAKNSIAFVCMVVSLCCFLILFLSTLRLPEVSSGKDAVRSQQTAEVGKFSKNLHLVGTFGEMMVEMLPQDLAFTVFVPSEKAFGRDLRLNVKESFVAENINNTYAIVSRVLGFSAIPRALTSDMVPVGEVSHDSLSGFTLYISKAVNGNIIVNGVRSESLDRRKGEIVVHIMDGVVMDADFKQSVQPDYDDG
ncbi:FAS1 domain-containing protein [Psidium guajava]|nr:FAS1 domain-containing protein [Psidium guajava]